MNTITAQTIVIPSTPLPARSISNFRNKRKIKIFGKTHKLIAWVMILARNSLTRYSMKFILSAVNRKTVNPIIRGNKNPDKIP
jgi:hypothetical protein